MAFSKLGSLTVAAAACLMSVAPAASAATAPTAAQDTVKSTPGSAAKLQKDASLTLDKVQNTPQIVGGEQANDPSVVQLVFQQNGGTYGCTGEVISPEWVLTAQHCTDGDTAMNVYFTNDTANRGTPIAADALYGSPNGDVALVHLSQATDAPAVSLADAYAPTPGDVGVIKGYGARSNSQPSDWLYQANVEVLGESIDAYYGNAIHVQGIDGASNHGDSGGPLIVDGQVVGVCSTGDSADPGSDINAGSNYANLTQSRDWITQVSGV